MNRRHFLKYVLHSMMGFGWIPPRELICELRNVCPPIVDIVDVKNALGSINQFQYLGRAVTILATLNPKAAAVVRLSEAEEKQFVDLLDEEDYCTMMTKDSSHTLPVHHLVTRMLLLHNFVRNYHTALALRNMHCRRSLTLKAHTDETKWLALCTHKGWRYQSLCDDLRAIERRHVHHCHALYIYRRLLQWTRARNSPLRTLDTHGTMLHTLRFLYPEWSHLGEQDNI